MEDWDSLNISIPDGNNPKSGYRKNSGIDGIGSDASFHKQFFTYELLSREVERVVLHHNLIEGCLENKELVSKSININLFRFLRSRSNSINLSKKIMRFL